jgi:hypothetical protein
MSGVLDSAVQAVQRQRELQEVARRRGLQCDVRQERLTTDSCSWGKLLEGQFSIPPGSTLSASCQWPVGRKKSTKPSGISRCSRLRRARLHRALREGHEHAEGEPKGSAQRAPLQRVLDMSAEDHLRRLRADVDTLLEVQRLRFLTQPSAILGHLEHKRA